MSLLSSAGNWYNDVQAVLVFGIGYDASPEVFMTGMPKYSVARVDHI